MDVEATVAKYLASACGIACYVVIPTERPEEFAFIEITSTSGNRFKRDYNLAVQAWAKTRKRACELAGKLADVAQDLDEETNIFSPNAEPAYSYADPNSKSARYQFVLHLTVCE